MSKAHIYQIVYDETSDARRDPGFLRLDNFANLRPDWFEYWPIRNYLLGVSLEDDDYYGFLSPRFAVKSGLSSDVVFATLEGRTEDVVIFSPYLDESALFLNVIEHGDSYHRGLASIFARATAAYWQPRRLIQSSSQIAFSNSFIARAPFWRRWLEICESIFAVAENRQSLLGAQLALPTWYGPRQGYAFKVFVVERVASTILGMEPGWTSIAPLALTMPMRQIPAEPLRDDLIRLDELKREAALAADPEPLLREYSSVRRRLNAIISPPAPPSTEAAHR